MLYSKQYSIYSIDAKWLQEIFWLSVRNVVVVNRDPITTHNLKIFYSVMIHDVMLHSHNKETQMSHL